MICQAEGKEEKKLRENIYCDNKFVDSIRRLEFMFELFCFSFSFRREIYLSNFSFRRNLIFSLQCSMPSVCQFFLRTCQEK
jgi:hypothetical protein